MVEDSNVGEIVKVSGPLVVARNLPGPRMYDLVRVGDSRLMGEIIELRGENVSVQVYEETGGLGPGDPVFPTGGALSVELGPGLLESIYDGVQRPLDLVWNKYGNYIERGVDMPGLSRDREWEFKPVVEEGNQVQPGDIIGTIQETSVAEHRVMVPRGISGHIVEIKSGKFKVTDVVAVIGSEDKNTEITLMQKWPVRNARQVKRKLAPSVPLVTGQRVIDTFFPVAKGGTACVPGPFGSGKTVIQHQIAKWADADIILYIGCGERGNEMTEVLLEFPELIDPYSGEPLIKRTVLIANTSNMPVAAREASVYTGITIAEYYRDMGYNVALQADSTSRWAEALREISGRLEEMPGEEGFPAYLGTRLASFYERAGLVKCKSSKDREGSITVVGAVSPPGGDLSEPVTQATLRVVKVFWGLEDKLAFRRHFPAINWLVSYSLYLDDVEKEWAKMVSPEFAKLRGDAMALLQEEAELQEIVRLIGIEALSPRERLSMESAKSVREDFLQQNAYDKIDSFSSLKKQFMLLRCVMAFDYAGSEAIEKGVDIRDVISIPAREEIAQAKFTPEDELEKIDELEKKIWETMEDLASHLEVKEALDIF